MIPPDPSDSHDHHDPLLRPFLRAADEAEAERCLEALLLTHAAPVIRRILGTEALLYPLGDATRRQRAEDVHGDVMVSLIERLRTLRAAPVEGSIPDFGGYVAVTTYNAVYQLLRKLFPRRANLKNKVRYLLEHHPALAMWQSGEGLFLTGLAAWRGQEKAVRGARLRQQLEQKEELARVGLLPDAAPSRMPLAELLCALLELAGQPVEYGELVAVVAELRGVKDQPDVHIEEAGEVARARWAGNRQGVFEQVEQRELLRRAWAEICLLPPHQRAAYLLNFRESQGHADITTFLFTRTASAEELAAALLMSPEELDELWPALPLSDAQIAARLGATQKQVVGLRSNARKRLKRRLGMMKVVAGAFAWLYPAALHIFNK